MVSLKKVVKKALGNTGSKILGTAIDTITGGTGSKLLLNGDSYINDAIKSATGMDGSEVGLQIVSKILGGLDTSEFSDNDKAIFGTIQNLLGGSGTNSGTAGSGLLGNLFGGVNWSNSVFSANQAKEMAKWNNDLNYNTQTKLNQQGLDMSKELLALQQGYDERMANTAVQRQMADLEKAGVNPALASSLGGAGGGGLGGGAVSSGGNAQPSKADWLALDLQRQAAARDEARVRIEQSNSASSASLMKKQEEGINANIAKNLVETGELPKQSEAIIKQALANAGKAHAETAVAEANVDKTKAETRLALERALTERGNRGGGLITKTLGTDPFRFLDDIDVSAQNYVGNKLKPRNGFGGR